MAATPFAYVRVTTGVRMSNSGRPTPAWYDDAKLGIFIHWGLYSVPGWATTTGTLDEAPTRLGWKAWFRDNSYAEWYANTLKIPGSPTAEHHRATYGDARYEDFAVAFNEQTRAWDPAEWANLFRQAGAGYVGITTKHHDGFCLWPSQVPHPTHGTFHAARDLVGDLANAVRGAGMRFGTYYSGGLDWSINPAPITDLPDLGATVIQDPVYAAYADAHLRELMDRYQTTILWNDIAYPRQSTLESIVADFYVRTPDGLVNDRFQDIAPDGSHRPLVPPDILTPEYTSFAETRPEKWETNRGIGYSFGYNKAEDEDNFIPTTDLIHLFVDIVSKNGNMLLNVGPRPDGSIQEGQLARLRALGDWLSVNGEAIRGTRPWQVAEGSTDAGDPVRFTHKGEALYATLLAQPKPGQVTLTGLRGAAETSATLLGHGPVPVAEASSAGLAVTIPNDLPTAPAHALRIEPVPGWIG
jgi:alpha-L-fucosidase